MVLNYNEATEQWENTQQLGCGDTWTLTFYCVPPFSFQLKWAIKQGPCITLEPSGSSFLQSPSSCDGLSVLFPGLGTGFLADCGCCEDGPYGWEILVTADPVKVAIPKPQVRTCPTPPPGKCGPKCKSKPPRGTTPKTPPPAETTSKPSVRYSTGEIVLEAVDLSAEGFGVPWGHTRSFASQLSTNDNIGNGYNWQVEEWTYLVIQSSGTVAVMGRANAVLWFDPVGNSYVPRFDVHEESCV